MKRSEAVQIIITSVAQAAVDFHEDCILTAAEASEVLEALEDAGMLPPRAQVLKRSTFSDDSGEVLFDELVGVLANEWEPEPQLPSLCPKHLISGPAKTALLDSENCGVCAASPKCPYCPKPCGNDWCPAAEPK